MALSVGTKAPDFTLPHKTADGAEPVTLSEQFAKGNTLLLFFPMAFTSTCTNELCDVSGNLAGYGSLNANVYGISGDNPFAQRVWADGEKITVPLLSDYDVAYDSFLPQLNMPMGGVAKRAAFIIDRVGVIQYVECLEDARELPDFEKIKAKLAELQ